MKGGMAGGGGRAAAAPNPLSSIFGGQGPIGRAIMNAMKQIRTRRGEEGTPAPQATMWGPVAGGGYPMAGGQPGAPAQQVFHDDFGRPIPSESPIAKALARRSNPYGM